MNEMSYKQGKYLRLIDRFADTGHKICEVTFGVGDKGAKQDAVIVQCINQAANRYNKPHIHAFKKDKKIYIVNTLLTK